MTGIPSMYRGKTVCLLGTGPSLTQGQIAAARERDFVLFGCNNVWETVPDLSVLWGTNGIWWDHYWGPSLAAYPAAKWTVNRAAATAYGINWTAERNAPGLSTDRSIIHHGHGGGFSMLNLAYLMGAERIVLLGYDLKYAADYDGRGRQVGSSPRHFFGEYPNELLHWPSISVRNGIHEELLELYASVAKQNPAEIVNCSPGSALRCFPMKSIDELI